MSKSQIWPALTFVLGLLVSSIAGSAYLHLHFATKESVQETESRLTHQLDRMEDKLDRLVESD
jgi:hypothetical protein